jgi:uncharacterized phage protein (TIGR02218 family)
MRQTVELEGDTLEIMGAIDPDNTLGVTSQDLRSGRFDHAKVEIGIFCWSDLTLPPIHVRSGFFGEVRIRDDYFVVELQGLNQMLVKEIISTYTFLCRIDLGSPKCSVDLDSDQTQDGTNIKFSGTINGIVDPTTFTANIGTSPDTHFFKDGLLKWTGTVLPTTRLNAGRTIEVDTHGRSGSTHTIRLLLPPTRPMSLNDPFDIYAGCDHRPVTCRTKFGPNDGRGNIRNYRGFPHIVPSEKFAVLRGRANGGIYRP